MFLNRRTTRWPSVATAITSGEAICLDHAVVNAAAGSDYQDRSRSRFVVASAGPFPRMHEPDTASARPEPRDDVAGSQAFLRGTRIPAGDCVIPHISPRTGSTLGSMGKTGKTLGEQSGEAQSVCSSDDTIERKPAQLLFSVAWQPHPSKVFHQDPQLTARSRRTWTLGSTRSETDRSSSKFLIRFFPLAAGWPESVPSRLNTDARSARYTSYLSSLITPYPQQSSVLSPALSQISGSSSSSELQEPNTCLGRLQILVLQLLCFLGLGI